MNRRSWVRLDTPSNIFLAARRDDDPKVFRLAAELHDDVDPDVLQRALDLTYDRHRLYHAVLRRGVFWYYLQDSELRPRVRPDVLPSCSAIYQPDRHELLFRVVYRYRRIGLEVFHALTDGTGALWFFSELVDAYARLRYPEEGGVSGEEPAGGLNLNGTDPGDASFRLLPDGFTEHFRGRGGRMPASDTSVTQPDSVGNDTPAARSGSVGSGRVRRTLRPRVYRVRGTRTPDFRTRTVELTTPAAGVLDLARELRVSPTIYLTGLFFEAVRLTAAAPGRYPLGRPPQRRNLLGRHRTVAASVPVNLRQFFPSESPRNFFGTVRVAHTYADGDAPATDSLESVCTDLETQFRAQIRPEALERSQRRLVRSARNPLLRVVPRMVKDVLLRLINWNNNRGLTVAVSNLGRVRFAGPSETHVGRVQFQVSAVRPQFCAITHDGRLTITFTSPFTQTDHVREFARMLTSRGLPVSVAAPRVTEEELAEARTGEAAAGGHVSSSSDAGGNTAGGSAPGGGTP